jgi:arylsulfatase A-like enzyme
MEVFAGFGEYTDFDIGRLIQAINDMGQLDNTLVFYIVGDNGASAEAGINGLPEPKSVNGTPQTPIQGTSMVYTFDDAKAKDKYTTQYFEIFGNRGIYHDGWLERSTGRPGSLSPVRRF